MTQYSRPGVFIQEVELPQTITVTDSGNAIGAFVGALAKGPSTVPVLLTSWIDFVKTFGGLEDAYPTTWAAYNFFANGGRQLYVKRVMGTGATKAYVTLTDRSGNPGADTLTITAKNPGTWGSELGVQVKAAGTADRFSLVIYNGANAVEQFSDLSMSSTDPRFVEAVLGTLSAYVDATVITANTTAAPDNMPATSLTPVSLDQAGADGSSPARADYQTATTTFDAIMNPLVFNAPDAAYIYTSTGTTEQRTLAVNIQADLVNYAENRGDGFTIIDVPSGSTVTEAQTFAAEVRGASAGGNAAAYFPWISIPNTLRSVPGAVRLQAPGAAMVGQYLATDASRGVFKTPAGIANRLSLAVATERQLSNTELDNLNTGEVPLNAIRQVPGAGIVAMGGRTLQNTSNARYINVRRSLIYIKKELSDRSQFAVFENNDERLWSRIRTALGAFLQSYWQQGGLRGATTKEAFFVRCDGTINSFADIQNGLVNIEVGVALEYPAEFVVIKLSQLTGSASA